MLDAIRLVWAILTAYVETPTPKEPPCQPNQQCEVKQNGK